MFVGMHLLFLKLKKIPKNVDPSCMVDMNHTGMWNEAILTRIIDIIIKKVQKPLLRQPVLILLASYGSHVKFVAQKSKYFERMQVFVKVNSKYDRLVTTFGCCCQLKLSARIWGSVQRFYGPGSDIKKLDSIS